MKCRAIFPMIVALMLAGCAEPQTAMAPPDQPERSPHVDRVRVELSTAFAPASTELPVGEATRLESFLDQAEVRPNDIAYVAVPPGNSLAPARVARSRRCSRGAASAFTRFRRQRRGWPPIMSS